MSVFITRSSIQESQTPDYYIGPSGSDSNDGSLGSPWAITALNTKRATYTGKRVGLLDGTYNVGSLMSTTRDAPALNVDGGTLGSPTIIQAVNARQAIITANNGAYGGGNGNRSAMLSHDGSTSHVGYVTFDGLVLKGCSLYCLEVGQYDFTNSLISGVTIQNCEITDNSAINSTVASGVNVCPLVIQKASGVLVKNCYFHDNEGWTDTTHFSAVYQWQSQGTIFEYCTLKNSGGFHGKEDANQGTTVRYCYIDWLDGPNGQNGSGIQGFDGAPTGGLTQQSSFHHNIILSNYMFLDFQAELNNGGWTTQVDIYNNTFITTSGIVGVGMVWYEETAGSRLLNFYNNLFYDSGNAPSGYGYILTNSDAFALCDYNLYGGSAKWNTVAGGNHNSSGASEKTSLSAWRTAIAGATGADANSTSSAATFSNNGVSALQYQTQSGAAFQTGKVGGVSGGATVNIGAWDGAVTRIGSIFNGVLD